MESNHSKIKLDENLNKIIKSNPKLEYILDENKEIYYEPPSIRLDPIKMNLLQKLIITEDPMILEYLMNNIHLYIDDINYQNTYGHTALMIVCKHIHEKKLDLVKLLLENGADPNLRDNQGNNSIINACYDDVFKNSNEIIKMLSNYKTNINLQNTDGDTALILSCKHIVFKEKNIKVLLENGADPNIQNKDGFTALMLLCEELDVHYNMEIYNIYYFTIIKSNRDITFKKYNAKYHIIYMKILLEYNSDISLKNNKGLTVSDIILQKPRTYSIDIMLKLLLDYGQFLKKNH